MAPSIRQRRKRREDRWGILLIVAVGIVLLAGVGGYAYFDYNRVRLERETLCPVDGPHEITVVLIDRTDQLSTVQRAALKSALEDIKNAIPRFAVLEVYSVGPIGQQLLRPELYLCNPGRGKDVGSLTENQHSFERKWQDFSAKVDLVLDEMLKPGEAKTSPVMESIQSIAVSAFAGSERRGIPKRLVIVSDMLQYTPEYSQYDRIQRFDTFQSSNYYRRVRADLTGADVEIIYIRRDTRKTVQGKAHIEFWQDYIRDANGSLTHVIPLEG